MVVDAGIAEREGGGAVCERLVREALTTFPRPVFGESEARSRVREKGSILYLAFIKIKINFAGGSPAAGYFLLLRQKKVTKEKATPIRHLFEVPCVARLVRRLRNSHDPLRVHVLRQSSPTSPD